MWAVIAGHATDLWGVVLVTVGVLAGLAFYADSLGPAGRYARLAVGDLFGWGRFLVPVVSVGVGLLLLIGRRDEEGVRAGPEPARAVIGATLTLLAAAGLAALAGGSPALRDSTAQLSSAGGWVGALVGNPLRDALGGFGAVTVLVAVVVVAMVVFTGVSVSSAAHGVVRAARWGIAVAGGGPADDHEDDLDDVNPTDPFGRAVKAGTGDGEAIAEPVVDDPDEAGEVDQTDEIDPIVADPDPSEATLLPAPARPVKGSQLEMKLGPTVGD
ncbi:MAG: DNA translocase FtsK 4TM domain-containing protein, partial [Acidimicrobiales bacterium]